MIIPCSSCMFYLRYGRYGYCTLFKGMVHVNTTSVAVEPGCPCGVPSG